MKFILFIFLSLASLVSAKSVAYIYGDVAADGTVPSGSAAPYDQMLLNDSGSTGIQMFRDLVLSQPGYAISDYYDVNTTLDANFLNQFDVIIFGLHQKIWSVTEKLALDTWLKSGGGMLIYSDSASGGLHSTVGIRNTVGQMATNNIISDYGMEVTVDQGGGTRSYISNVGSSNPIVWDQPELEGEGVSPVAVDLNSGAQVLIPLSSTNRVGGGNDLNIDDRNITIANPEYACLALRVVGDGNVIALFDRQPMWNNGPGSDIERKDNSEILRRTVRFLARDYGNSPEWLQFHLAPNTKPLELSWRQWKGGVGVIGSTYTVKNTRFKLEHSSSLLEGSWGTDGGLMALVGPPIDNNDETETVTIRLSDPQPDTSKLFARLARVPTATNSEVILVNAGQDRYIGENGRVSLESSISGGAGPLTITWSAVSGPGDVTFTNTSATFSQAGDYEIEVSATDGESTETDRMNVRVVANSAIVRAINCGNVNSGFTGLNGFTYEKDTLFAGGRIDAFPGNAVLGTEDDGLYNYARSQFTTYTIPVPSNGNYTVYFQFSETFFTSANQRVFDVSVEGALALNDLDLAAVAPGRWVAYNQAFTTFVDDGNIVISSTASVNNSLLNAIVVVQE